MSITVFGYAIKLVYMILVFVGIEIRTGTLNFVFKGRNLGRTVVTEMAVS
jgi:hypothetical protein